jgi:hypothetical protein
MAWQETQFASNNFLPSSAFCAEAENVNAKIAVKRESFLTSFKLPEKCEIIVPVWVLKGYAFCFNLQ